MFTTNSGPWLRRAQSEGPLVTCRTLSWKAPSRVLPHNWGTSVVNKAQILLASSAAHSREHWSHEAAASVVISKTCLPGKARLQENFLLKPQQQFSWYFSKSSPKGPIMVISRLWRHSILDGGVGTEEWKIHQHAGLVFPWVWKTDEFIHSPRLFSSLFLSLRHQYKWTISRLPLIWAPQKLTLLNWVRTQVVI